MSIYVSIFESCLRCVTFTISFHLCSISSMSVTAPGVVVYKHTDIYEPHTIHSGAFTEDDLTQFVQNAAHSTFVSIFVYMCQLLY